MYNRMMSASMASPVPVVIAFTSNYIIPAATCLQSILAHTGNDSRFHIICLLTEELPDEQKKALAALDTKGRLEFSFLKFDENDLQGVYVDPRYTIVASFRLMIASLLPQYDKIIYSDCDVIIRNDIANLYRQTEFSDGEYLAAVYESPLPFQEENIKKIGCIPGKYFNSGFLVMNLKKIREEEVEKKFTDALRSDYLEFPDQDVLNIVCQDRVKALSPIYNSIRTFFLPQYKSYFLESYSIEDWEAVQEHGTIHYTGSKPWRSFTVKFDVWWRYYYSLPKEVRRIARISTKYKYLYRLVFSHTVGRAMVDIMRSIYRSIR